MQLKAQSAKLGMVRREGFQGNVGHLGLSAEGTGSRKPGDKQGNRQQALPGTPVRPKGLDEHTNRRAGERRPTRETREMNPQDPGAGRAREGHVCLAPYAASGLGSS